MTMLHDKDDYLTTDQFARFIANEFAHLKWKVNALLWLVGLVLAGIIAEWATK